MGLKAKEGAGGIGRRGFGQSGRPMGESGGLGRRGSERERNLLVE